MPAASSLVGAGSATRPTIACAPQALQVSESAHHLLPLASFATSPLEGMSPPPLAI